LFFGVDKNSGNAIISKMYEHFHGYNSILVNKFPVFQSNPELFGMVLLSLGIFIMAGAAFYLRNSK
jgi:hypothetical protein